MRALLTALLTLAGFPAFACGPESDCAVLGNRAYRYYAPEVEGPVGAFFHAHGYRGSGQGAMRNMALRSMADRLGLIFVALDSEGGDWELAHTPRRPERQNAEEYEYISAVIADLSSRMDLDSERLVATGFSAGGMMTWTLACGMSEAFAGFVPYSGTFWAPVPAACPTPAAPLIHIHGTSDRTVPLMGRPIAATRQGEVPFALDMYRAHGDFAPMSEGLAAPGNMTCAFEQNSAGAELGFCTFDGGHSYSVPRVEWAIERILGTP